MFSRKSLADFLLRGEGVPHLSVKAFLEKLLSIKGVPPPLPPEQTKSAK